MSGTYLVWFFFRSLISFFWKYLIYVKHRYDRCEHFLSCIFFRSELSFQAQCQERLWLVCSLESFSLIIWLPLLESWCENLAADWHELFLCVFLTCFFSMCFFFFLSFVFINWNENRKKKNPGRKGEKDANRPWNDQ